jgi:hypothetical protein
MKKRTKRRRKGGYKRGIHASPKAGECKYRSGWELAYMLWLDQNVDVLEYSYEKVQIQYVSNKRTGKLRTYFPDFLVKYPDRTELVEIKPSKRLQQAKVVKKLTCATFWCQTHGAVLKVMTEKELGSLGII